MRQSFKEVIKYGIVGLIGLVVEFGTFFVFRDLLGFNYIVAHVLGCILAIINNFILNSYFTFKATDKIWKRAVSFFGIAGVGLLLNAFLLPTLVKLINVSLIDTLVLNVGQKTVQTIAKLMSTVIVACFQFIFNKYFTFKKKVHKCIKNRNK